MWVLLVLTIGSVTSDLGHRRHTAQCPPAHCSDTHQDGDTSEPGRHYTLHIAIVVKCGYLCDRILEYRM